MFRIVLLEKIYRKNISMQLVICLIFLVTAGKTWVAFFASWTLEPFAIFATFSGFFSETWVIVDNTRSLCGVFQFRGRDNIFGNITYYSSYFVQLEARFKGGTILDLFSVERLIQNYFQGTKWLLWESIFLLPLEKSLRGEKIFKRFRKGEMSPSPCKSPLFSHLTHVEGNHLWGSSKPRKKQSGLVIVQYGMWHTCNMGGFSLIHGGGKTCLNPQNRAGKLQTRLSTWFRK